LRSLADKMSTRCVLAHVRAARRFDPISRANCHPFKHGELLWMHNGDIPGRGRLHRRVAGVISDELAARIHGSTDTELAFALFLHLLGPERARASTAEELADALERTIDRLLRWWRKDEDTRPIVMNFCVSNGRSIVALRLALEEPEVPTLHACAGARFVCADGVCRIEKVVDGPGCAMVASEVLSDDPHWVTVENGELVLAHENFAVETRKLPIDLS
jgi:predicted glutamine amidotransferase